jgi:hypothetical protein
VRCGLVSPGALAAAVAELAPLLDRRYLLDGDGRLAVGYLRARARRLLAAHAARR